jgi:hypothetical protein
MIILALIIWEFIIFFKLFALIFGTLIIGVLSERVRARRALRLMTGI